MYSQQRSHLTELLDAVQAEYNQLAQEAMLVKNQRDEYELKSKGFCTEVCKGRIDTEQ